MATSLKVGQVNELTLLTPIKRGPVKPGSALTYTTRLRLILDSVQRRIALGQPISLDIIPTLHAARWVILPNQSPRDRILEDHDGDPGQDQLLLTAIFNGTFIQYLRDLATFVAEDVDRIYEHCEGYPKISNFDQFLDYTERHMIDTSVLYVADPHRSITVRDERKLLAMHPSHPREARA